MRRFRPLVALFANLVLVHAMWIGSGLACVIPDMSDMPPGAMVGTDSSVAAIGAMDMPDMAGRGQTPTHEQSPCQFPWAPDGCQSMTPCLPLAITSPAQALRADDATPVAVATLRVLMPPSRARSPEPPPPRA